MLTLAAAMPESATAVSAVMGTMAPALGERGPVTTSNPRAPRWRAACALKRSDEYRENTDRSSCSASSGK